MIALISSVPFESELIRASLNDPQPGACGPRAAHYGEINSLPVIVISCGIGKVNAAWAATVLCEHFPLRVIINHGVCGAYTDTGLDLGHIAVAQKEIYGDEGVIEPDRWYGLERIGIPSVEQQGRKYFNEFECDPHLSVRACEAIEKSAMTMNTQYGIFVTLSTSSGRLTTGIEYQNRFKAICENMEGAAIAHIAKLYSIPFIEIRGVSNRVEDRNLKKWNLPLAAQNSQNAVLEVLKDLSRDLETG